MLKFFFNRFSKVVYAMEIFGVSCTAGWLWKMLDNPPSRFTQILFGLYLAEYLFLRLCTTLRWHRQARRYEGIELQFKKAMIPTSYLLALTSGVGWLTGFMFLLPAAVVLLAVIAHVNVILIYLYWKDKNTTPINYFSNNRTLNASR